MILVTGGLGFIGSALIKELNDQGINNILIVDSFRQGPKWRNVRDLSFKEFIHTDEIFLEQNEKTLKELNQVYHMGACSSTTEEDMDFLWKNNVLFSQKIFKLCSEREIPLVYASSAATYGDGTQGFDDCHDKGAKLRPLNKYGYSKQFFDRYALLSNKTPPHWYGLKFFNVYGPNEYHKGSMRSVVKQAHEQILAGKKVKLFESYKNGIAHGEQKRDFVYVKDVCKAMFMMMNEGDARTSGIYNMGTGVARSFKDLAIAAFKALELPENIEYIPMPENIRDQYQYFTEARMEKFFKAFNNFKFSGLEEGVKDYISHHLENKNPYLQN